MKKNFALATILQFLGLLLLTGWIVSIGRALEYPFWFPMVGKYLLYPLGLSLLCYQLARLLHRLFSYQVRKPFVRGLLFAVIAVQAAAYLGLLLSQLTHWDFPGRALITLEVLIFLEKYLYGYQFVIFIFADMFLLELAVSGKSNKEPESN